MTPLSLFSRTITCFSILVATLTTPSLTTPVLANESEDAQALVDNVVRLIDNQHLDSPALPAAWERQREQLLSRTYTDETEARAHIARALEYLNDPYTYLLSPSEFEAMQDSVAGDAACIGIRLVLGSRGAPTVSAPPLLGSPAFYSGIQQGDVIVAVDGRNSEAWTPGQTLQHIQGRENSTVQLTLMRNSQRIEVEVVRTNLSQPSVTYSVRSYQDESNRERQVGYIRLARFDDRAAEDMKAAIVELESRSVDGYVLDLRSNPGGLLGAGTAIAELFLDGEAIVTVQDRDRVRRIVDRKAPMTSKPLTLLVDGGSASSSEVLAGALRDAERATLVGTRTFGKGVVQTLYVLPDDSSLAISTANYRTPNGHNLHGVGLHPDVTVAITNTEFAMLAQHDPQYSAAVDSLFGQSPSSPTTPGTGLAELAREAVGMDAESSPAPVDVATTAMVPLPLPSE
ncbi:MAG: S41 family peptidase [Synechococcus sp.]